MGRKQTRLAFQLRDFQSLPKAYGPSEGVECSFASDIFHLHWICYSPEPGSTPRNWGTSVIESASFSTSLLPPLLHSREPGGRAGGRDCFYVRAPSSIPCSSQYLEHYRSKP